MSGLIKPDLDDPASYSVIDPEGVYRAVAGFPAEIESARGLSAAFSPPDRWPAADKVIVLGMGGSGIAGRVLGAYVDSCGGPPTATYRGYEIPRWVDAQTLVLAVSYSGNTAETLSGVQAAVVSGASVLAVTSGGKLGALAEDRGFPCITVPSGRLPRHSLGYLAVPLFECLSRAGIIARPPLDEVIEAMKKRGREWGAEVPTADNEPKRLAREIHEKGYFPVVYGAGDVAAVAAERTRAQLAEDAKLYASGHFFPELCHNEVVGYEGGDERLKDFYVVAYRGPGENDMLARQTDAALDIISAKVGGARQVRPRSAGVLAGLFELIYFGDFLAYYIALLRGVDPAPVKTIVELKERMK